MDYSSWFQRQLHSSAEGFAWAVKQVPNARMDSKPPEGLGQWTALRHAFHLGFYESSIALPNMRQWLGEAIPEIEDLDEEDLHENEHWENDERNREDLISHFQSIR